MGSIMDLHKTIWKHLDRFKCQILSVILLVVPMLGCHSRKTASLHLMQQKNPDWLNGLMASSESTEIPSDVSNDQALVEMARSEATPFRYDLLNRPLDEINNRSASSATDSPPVSDPESVALTPSGGVHVTVNNVGGLSDSDKKSDSQETEGPLSRIETLYNTQGIVQGKALRQFGYQHLVDATPKSLLGNKDMKTLFLAENDQGPISYSQVLAIAQKSAMPVAPDYLIGPGDEILLQTTGTLQINQTLTVNRDGLVFIPQVGSVSLAGINAVVQEELSSHGNRKLALSRLL